MKPTDPPKNYAGMLSQFLEGWVKDREFYEVQHKEVLPDGSDRWWPPVRVLGITHLMRLLRSYPPQDNYLTAQRYSSMSGSHTAPIIDRIYVDIDPPSNAVPSLLDDLPFYRRIQDALRDESGLSPVVVVYSGRGFHLWVYLDRPVTVDDGASIQAGLCERFEIPFDPRVPIEDHRMMRLPFFVNTKTGHRAVWCTERMTLEEVHELATSQTIETCRWDPVYRVSPETLPHSKEAWVFDARRNPKARSRSVMRRPLANLTAGDLPLPLRIRAVELLRKGKSVDEVAVELRRTRAEVSAVAAGLDADTPRKEP